MSIPLPATPLCPLLLQARATPTLVAASHSQRGMTTMVHTATWPEPAEAPGVACVGSRCAWWEPETELDTFADDRERQDNGRCAQAPGARWRRDPALGSAS